MVSSTTVTDEPDDRNLAQFELRVLNRVEDDLTLPEEVSIIHYGRSRMRLLPRSTKKKDQSNIEKVIEPEINLILDYDRLPRSRMNKGLSHLPKRIIQLSVRYVRRFSRLLHRVFTWQQVEEHEVNGGKVRLYDSETFMPDFEQHRLSERTQDVNTFIDQGVGRGSNQNAYLDTQNKLFENQKDALLSLYEGKYVIFKDGEVILAEDNEVKLIDMAYQKLGFSQPFLLRQVLREEPEYRIDTPIDFSNLDEENL
jgi:hypothetical protein